MFTRAATEFLVSRLIADCETSNPRSDTKSEISAERVKSEARKEFGGAWRVISGITVIDVGVTEAMNAYRPLEVRAQMATLVLGHNRRSRLPGEICDSRVMFAWPFGDNHLGPAHLRKIAAPGHLRPRGPR
jgi:hypothetical protein